MNKTYWPLWLLLILVLAAGMFFPKLMDTDAPEYAGIAMHMHQQNNWADIVNRTYENGQAYDYLDKPHVLFWSAWPGYQLFGATDYGYRLVSILMSLLAAMATAKLGGLLYNKRVGQVAALMFMTSQAILLANHDVRTDSLLTSFVVLAVWQLVLFIQKNKWQHLLWAGAFLAGGVGTKGMIAVLVVGSVTFFYLLGQRNFKTLFTWKWAILLASFLVFLSPVLYYYYQQFDLHPEKLVNGSYGMSGIKFLLWTQSFERFAGDRTFVDNPEFSFLFHSLLWAMLPWSVLCYSAVVARIKEAGQTRGKSLWQVEQLTFAGVWAMFIFMSMSSFKLPHYINVLFPFMSIFTAQFVHQFFQKGNFKALRIIRNFQWVIVGILGVLFVVLNGWAFPVQHWGVALAILLFAAIIIWYFLRTPTNLFDKAWVPSAATILLVNFGLNLNFYPQIARYQGGSAMAEVVKEMRVDKQQLFLYHTVLRSFDFYLQDWRPMLSDTAIRDRIAAKQPTIIFTNDDGIALLQKSFVLQELSKQPDFHITGLNAQFINPKTRSNSYGFVHLVAVAGVK